MRDSLLAIAENEALLEVGRQAIENAAIEFRDRGISCLNRGNGIAVRWPDGRRSDLIRFGPEVALRIALRAIADHLQKKKATPRGWRYFWRRYLGWMPLQFCMVCGRPYWGGFPRWWGSWTWLPWWMDYCSRACADWELEHL